MKILLLVSLISIGTIGRLDGRLGNVSALPSSLQCDKNAYQCDAYCYTSQEDCITECGRWYPGTCKDNNPVYHQRCPFGRKNSGSIDVPNGVTRECDFGWPGCGLCYESQDDLYCECTGL